MPPQKRVRTSLRGRASARGSFLIALLHPVLLAGPSGPCLPGGAVGRRRPGRRAEEKPLHRICSFPSASERAPAEGTHRDGTATVGGASHKNGVIRAETGVATFSRGSPGAPLRPALLARFRR